MKTIKTLDSIPQAGLDILQEANYNVTYDGSKPDAIIVRSKQILSEQLGDNLLVIARAGAGTNNIPVSECSEKGIVVFNTPGANANAVKEATIAALLLVSRGITEGISFANSLDWTETDTASAIEKAKKQFAGNEIAGKTIGIIGLGKIGILVANACAGLGMNVFGYDPYISVESAWEVNASIHHTESLEKLMNQSDYLSLHIPLNSKTENLINSNTLAYVKQGVRIVNLSRAEIVNNEAINVAIQSGRVSKYITDFPCHGLPQRPEVIAMPHLGASTKEAEENCSVMASLQIRDFIEKGTIRNSVNFPNTELQQATTYRLVILNKNIPNMVGQITTSLAKLGINITSMLNASKGEYACSLIDIHCKLPETIISEINKTDGVLRIRQIISE